MNANNVNCERSFVLFYFTRQPALALSFIRSWVNLWVTGKIKNSNIQVYVASENDTGQLDSRLQFPKANEQNSMQP